MFKKGDRVKLISKNVLPGNNYLKDLVDNNIVGTVENDEYSNRYPICVKWEENTISLYDTFTEEGKFWIKGLIILEKVEDAS